MSEHNDPGRRSLNPFVFPSETGARFTLLMIAAFAMAFALAHPLLQLINPQVSDSIYENFPVPPPEGLPPVQFFTQEITYGLNAGIAALKALAFPTILFIVILGVAAFFYWDHPRRVRAGKSIRPFKPTDDLLLTQEISYLSAEIGLAKNPKIEIGKGLSEQDGQAFGTGHQKTLWLGGGLRLLLRKTPETFRAMIRHELAHIVNNDIGQTYYAQALWISVVLLTIVPLFLVSTYIVLGSTFQVVSKGLYLSSLKMLFLEKYPSYFWVIIQSIGLVVIMAWIWASILRIRENYADWRAALLGSKSSLVMILTEAGQANQKKNFGIRFHPSRAERLSILDNPRQLFEMDFGLPFVVGLLTALILNGIIPILLLLLIAIGPAANIFPSWFILFARDHPGAWMPLLKLVIDLCLIAIWVAGILLFFLPFALITHLYSATLGMQTQRQAMSDLVEHKLGVIPYLSLFLRSGMVSIGLIVGVVATPFSFFVIDSLQSGSLILFLLLAFSVFVWLALACIRFFSQQILATHLKSTQPVGKQRLVSFLSYLFFLGAVLPFLFLLLFVLLFVKGAGENHWNVVIAFVVVFAAAFLVLVGQVGAFAIQRLILFVYRSFRPVKCPVCGKPIAQYGIVGKECPACQANLGAWVFTEQL
jgi:hypothetical protein